MKNNANISTFGGRIKSLREMSGLSQEEFGKKIDTKLSAISMWERDQRKPDSHELLYRIAKEFNVTLDWLLTGEESTFKPPITDLKTLKGSDARPSNAQFYPLIDRVTAGDYSANVVSEHIVEYFPVNYHRKDCFLVEVDGDSMTSSDPEISISPGDLLLVDPIEVVSPGDLVVAKLTTTRHMVKQFFISDDRIELRSFNPSQPSIFITSDQLEYIFRVVFHQPKGKKK